MDLIKALDQVNLYGKVGDIFYWQWEMDFLKSIPREAWLTIIMKIFTFLGEAGILWIALSIVFVIFPKTRKCGFTMIISMVATLIIGNGILKNCFARFRPAWVDVDFFNAIKGIKNPKDYAFPSGHTMNGITASMVILFCTIKEKKKIILGVGAVLLACIIAFSRMYLFVHWPTDIMAGALVGLTTAIISFVIMDKKLWPVIDGVFANVKKAIDRKKRRRAEGKE